MKKRFDKVWLNINREIVEKIDVNKDGGVTLDELKDWINGIEKIRVNAGVEERWKMFSKEDTLEIYLDKNYGLLDQCKLN